MKDETPTAGAPATAPQLRDLPAIFNKRSVSEASDESELKKTGVLAAVIAEKMAREFQTMWKEKK